jgi:hypothetical protein
MKQYSLVAVDHGTNHNVWIWVMPPIHPLEYHVVGRTIGLASSWLSRTTDHDSQHTLFVFVHKWQQSEQDSMVDQMDTKEIVFVI